MSGEVNVVALVRGEEQYVFVFDEARRTELLRLLGRYAADPELAFNWYDAAILSQKIREMMPATVSNSTVPGANHSNSVSPSSPTSSIKASKRTRAPRFRIP